MQNLPGKCFMCLRDGNLRKLSFNDQDSLFNIFVKYVLPDYIIPEQDQSQHICSICQFSLQSFYKFKKMCMENNKKEYTICSEIKIEVHDEQDEISTLTKGSECDEEEVLSLKQEIKDEDIQHFETTEDPMKTTLPKYEIECIQNNTGIMCSVNQEENQTGSTNVETKLFENFYKCYICYKVFRRKYFFNLHMKIHIGVKEYDCSTCNKSFASKSALMIHKRIHTNAKKFECAMCSKQFNVKRYLVQHVESHIGTKNFQCSFCNKKFLRKRYLEEHEKIHRDVKDFKCSVCGKEFRQKVNLTKHLLIHSGVKKYECPVCNKRFTEKSALNRHVKIHIKNQQQLSLEM